MFLFLNLFKYYFSNQIRLHIFKIIYLYFLLIFLFNIIFNSYINFLLDIYSGIFWFILIIINFLSLENMFKLDVEIGFFEYLLHQNYSLNLYLFFKILIYWIIYILPLVLLLLLQIYFLYNLKIFDLFKLSCLLLLQSYCFTLITSIGSIFIVKYFQMYLLIFMLIIPLLIPSLLIGIIILITGCLQLLQNMHIIIVLMNFLFLIICIPYIVNYLIKINFN